MKRRRVRISMFCHSLMEFFSSFYEQE